MSKTIEMPERAAAVAEQLKLLANPNRLMIVCRLMESELSVGEIETELGIRQPTLSRELGRLRDEGVITARRQSKVVFYSLTDENVKHLVSAICEVTLGQPAGVQSLGAPLRAAGGSSAPFLARPKFVNPRLKRARMGSRSTGVNTPDHQ